MVQTACSLVAYDGEALSTYETNVPRNCDGLRAMGRVRRPKRPFKSQDIFASLTVEEKILFMITCFGPEETETVACPF
jgi:hypothetical protein